MKGKRRYVLSKAQRPELPYTNVLESLLNIIMLAVSLAKARLSKQLKSHDTCMLENRKQLMRWLSPKDPNQGGPRSGDNLRHSHSFNTFIFCADTVH